MDFAQYIAPSWSWAAVPGRVKNLWPLDTTPPASIQDFDVTPLYMEYPLGKAENGYIVVRGLIGKTWSTRTGDIEVNAFADDTHKVQLSIRCTLDRFDPDTTKGPSHLQLYGIRMTRRIGLLLAEVVHGDGTMERVGLMIVAKPDTLKWTAMIGERDVKIV